MSRKRDRTLVKIYKDLMITKRDLIDLRESINNTIVSIRESDEHMKRIEVQRKLRKDAQFQITFNHGNQIPFYHAKCEKCYIVFPNFESLHQHQSEKHVTCKDCQQELNESMDDHLLFSCGETKLQCEICSSLVKKSQFDAHMKICCFRECYKCHEEISTRAYSFHLQECRRGKNSNLIKPCRQLSKPIHNRALVIPCCLVFDD